VCLPTALGCQTLKGSGDFGTSPFYGQLPGQASSSLPMPTNMGGSTPKHNKGFEYFKYLLVRVEPAERQVSWGAVILVALKSDHDEQFYTDSPWHES
jgi:hypothetical protein